MPTSDQTLWFDELLTCKLGEVVVRAQRNKLDTNMVEARWKSSDKANQKGVVSRVNHVTKAAAGYMKHSTGKG